MCYQLRSDGQSGLESLAVAASLDNQFALLSGSNRPVGNICIESHSIIHYPYFLCCNPIYPSPSKTHTSRRSHLRPLSWPSGSCSPNLAHQFPFPVPAGKQADESQQSTFRASRPHGPSLTTITTLSPFPLSKSHPVTTSLEPI